MFKLTTETKKQDSSKIFKKNVSIVFIESIGTKGLNFLNILMLTYLLSTSSYGKYSYLFVSIAFLSAFLDFGSENTAIRFSGKKSIEEKKALFGLYLVSKLFILLLLSLVLFFLGDKIFMILDKKEIIKFIPYLLLGIIGEGLFFINDTFLQSNGQFKKRALINLSRFVLTCLITATFLYFEIDNLDHIVIIFLIPLIYSIFFFKYYYQFFKALIKIGLHDIREILSYTKWMVLVSIPNNILGRIDFFLISIWATYSQLGIYNFGYQLSAMVAIIPYALGKVLLPHMSHYSSHQLFEETDRIIRKVKKISIAVSVFSVIAINVFKLFIQGDYLNSMSVLTFMALTAIMTFVSIPVEQAIYVIGKPNLILYSKLVQILLILVFSFIPQLLQSIVAMSLLILITKIIYSYILYKIYRKYKLREIKNKC